MNKGNIFFFSIWAIMMSVTTMSAAVKVHSMQGEVKVRRGVEEHWQPAMSGTELHEIDTILTLEGSATLKLADGSLFKLGPNSIVDVGDLRLITRQEMFVLVMSQKVQKIAPRVPKSFKPENISSVHGLQSTTAAKPPAPEVSWQRELNAARAMVQQRLLTNAVVKLHRLINRHTHMDDCGEALLLLGKSYEALDESGQAIDFYQAAADKGSVCKDGAIAQEARAAQQRLTK